MTIAAIGRRCEITGCEKPHFGRGMCHTHYYRWYRTGDADASLPVAEHRPQGPVCEVASCGRKPHAKGLCISHFSRLRLTGDARPSEPLRQSRAGCVVENCDRKHAAFGYCRLHWRRLTKLGSTDLPSQAPKSCCAAQGCDRPVRSNGLCNAHAERLRLGRVVDGPIRKIRVRCELSGCDRAHYSLGFCLFHYAKRVTRPRRLALEAVAVGVVTAAQVQARIDYYGGRCWMCGSPWTCLDHVKPLARGGCNWPSNLRPACRSCNARKQHRWPYPTTSIIGKARECLAS